MSDELLRAVRALSALTSGTHRHYRVAWFAPTQPGDSFACAVTDLATWKLAGTYVMGEWDDQCATPDDVKAFAMSIQPKETK